MSQINELFSLIWKMRMDSIFHICHIFITCWWCIYTFQNSVRYVSGQEGWVLILRISIHSQDGPLHLSDHSLHILTNKSNGSLLNLEQVWTPAWLDACRQKYKAKLTSFSNGWVASCYSGFIFELQPSFVH